MRGWPWICGVFLVGCAQPRDEMVTAHGASVGAMDATGGPGTGDGDDDDDDDDDDEGADGTTSTDTSMPGSDDDGDLPKLDVGTDAGSGLPTTGCSAVDILFVVDNSGSMCSYQSSLAQTLPDFADAMFGALPEDTSLHVGITTTSFTDGGTHNEQNCASVQGATEIEAAYETPIESVGTDNGFQGRLLEYEGLRWFEADTGDASTRLPLMEWFANAAFSVDCSGGAYEFPSASAGYVFDPINAATNDGFVRDEGAVLVIFILSDEVDQSPEGIEHYRDQVLAAKAGCGGSTCVLTAGLLNAGCVPDADPIVWQFLNAFEHEPVWGSIGDEAGYGDVVHDALTGVIAQTCDLIPAG